MGRKIVIANLKMHMDLSDTFQYMKDLEKYKDKNLVICPTSIFIPYFLEKNFHVGIQKIHEQKSGAYTGFISAVQAASLGIRYAMIGHSESHDENISIKVKECLLNGLKVIACFGEDDVDDFETVCIEQISCILKDIQKEDISNIYFAYEPIRAINQDFVLDIELISSKILFIKEYIEKEYGFVPLVLYGGNVHASNIHLLNEIDLLDGYLVGRASLVSEEFKKILEVVDI